MKRYWIIASLLAVTFVAHGSRREARPSEVPAEPIRALLIVAHPDDEYEMAATIYRITKELSGVVDQIIITDGEAGYRYSSLASSYYGVDLTNEATGRAKLPRIREEEARRAARIIGIRHQWFLNERDDHFTTEVEDALKTWHSDRVVQELSERLRDGNYDLVFVVLPAKDTHGQHKAASILALEAVQRLPKDRQPAVLGVEADPGEDAAYTALPGYPVTETVSKAAQFHFDRASRFGFRDALSYEIVVDWVIAEHKSQGLFQTKCGQDRFENFWIFTLGGEASAKRATTLFKGILEPHLGSQQSAGAQ